MDGAQVPALALRWLCLSAAIISIAAAPAGAQNGTLVQWGGTGQGQAYNQPPSYAQFISVAARQHLNAALTPTGSMITWGSSFPVWDLPFPSATERFSSVALGWTIGLNLRPDGSLVQWAFSTNGQLNNAPAPNERFVAIAAGGYHSLALRADGSLVQWGDTSSNQAANAPPGTERFMAIACGYSHNLALRQDGTLVQWGDTASNQANNIPAPTERFTAISCGWAFNLALRTDGSLVQWGDTTGGQSNNAPAATERFVKISAGNIFSLALRADGSLVQWGRTADGQTLNAPAPTERFGDIAAGGWHSIALRGAGLPASGVAFTYQGRLTGQSGPIDLRARIFDSQSGGNSVSDVSTNLAVTPDANGLFTTLLRFSYADLDGDRWLELAIAPAGSGTYSTLSPRQPLTSVPKAIIANTANESFSSLSALRADTADTAGYATTAGSASTADSATTAGSVPWSGITGVPSTVTDPFLPWTTVTGGIGYSSGHVGIGTASPQQPLQVGDANVTSDGIIRIVSTTRPNQFVELSRAWEIAVPHTYPGTAAAYDFTITDASVAGYSALTNPMFMIQQNTGNVGIGTPGPDQKLTVNGNASKPGGGSWAVFSDPRLKHDIEPMTGTLDRLLQLRGYSFAYNDDVVADGKCLPGRQIGLMADEVERVFPDWVSRDSKGMRMVTERSTTALLVESLRDLRKELADAAETSRRQVEALRTENAAKQAALEAMDARLKALEQAKEPQP